MTRNRTALLVIGFLLAGIGFLSIVLSLIGLQFSFLVWLDAAGKGLGFLLKIILTLVGFVLIYLAYGNFEADNR